MFKVIGMVALAVLFLSNIIFGQANTPHLLKIGNTAVLMVDEKPFFIRGGELGNSTFTSVESMEPVWPKLKAMHLNTVLAPVYWELIEPREGAFDFGLLDDLIIEARKNDLKLVLLWFGSWKNSMSSHVPQWIKKDQKRFPRSLDEKGVSQEILTPFSENNMKADLKAFEALMAHIKTFDADSHTVIMVQPENEIGMLPSAKDYHPLSMAKFQAQVPAELMAYLTKNKNRLVPEFLEKWEKNGAKTSGNWEEVFGPGFATDEIFMAWYFAKYTEAITKAGKQAYNLPMFVNAALIRPGKIPGEYPSAGPLPHLMDIWKAGAPSVDFLSPDFYNPDFEEWNDKYVRQNNVLFVPEHRFDATTGAKALFTIGHYGGLGFSPFSIENGGDKESTNLKGAYEVIDQMTPLLGQFMVKGMVDGVLLDKDKVQSTVVLGDYEFSFKNSYTLGWEAGASNAVWDYGGAIIIQTGDDEFYIGGAGIVITFKNWKNRSKNVGILVDEEGYFKDGKWIIKRYLNGDQTHQGRHVRIAHGEYGIQRVRLYEY